VTEIIGNWQQQQVGDHTCHLFEPQQRNEYGYVVIYLHGIHLAQLMDKPAFVKELETHGLPVVAPESRRSWWTDRICDEFDPGQTAERYLLDEVLPFIEQSYGSSPPRIALLGTSMGGQGALRLAYKYPDTFPIVAALSPAIDYQNRFDFDETISGMYSNAEAARQDTATLHIHPLNWPRNQFFSCCPQDFDWFDSSDRLHMKLSSLGVPHECDLETEGGGHGFGYYNVMAERAIQYLAEKLNQERRRLPS